MQSCSQADHLGTVYSLGLRFVALSLSDLDLADNFASRVRVASTADQGMAFAASGRTFFSLNLLRSSRCVLETVASIHEAEPPRALTQHGSQNVHYAENSCARKGGRLELLNCLSNIHKGPPLE